LLPSVAAIEKINIILMLLSLSFDAIVQWKFCPGSGQMKLELHVALLSKNSKMMFEFFLKKSGQKILM
jgi:hypothetical protein